MPNSKCCLCPKRIATNDKKNFIGRPKLKLEFVSYVGPSRKDEFDYSSAMVCQKCYAKIRNYYRRQGNRSCNTRFQNSENEESDHSDNHDPHIEDHTTNENAIDVVEGDCADENVLPIEMSQDNIDSLPGEYNAVNINPEAEVNVRLQLDSVVSTQKKCCICGSTGGRKRIPKAAIQHAWIQRSIYIPEGNRTCAEHLEGKVFKQTSLLSIVSKKQQVSLSESEVSRWILELTRSTSHRFFNFDDPTTVTEEDYEFLVGFDEQQFEIILHAIEIHIKNSRRRSKRNALAIFLMFLRHNLTQVAIINLLTL